MKVAKNSPPKTQSSSVFQTHTNISKGDAFSIFGFIFSHPFEFLIDTGSSITAISFSTWLKFLLPDSHLSKTHMLSLRSASGTPLHILGTFDCIFQISGSFYPFHTYVIQNLAHDVVLGRDFLTNFESTIDLANYRLHLASPPPLPPISSIPSKASLHAPDQLLVLPARTETVFPISCHQLPGTQGLVTPAQQLQNKYKLAGAHLLCSVSPTKTIPFRILNPNPYAVVLYPNTTLGEFESIESQISTIDSLQNHSSATSPSNSSTTVPTFDFSNSTLTSPQRDQLKQLLSNYSDIFATHDRDLGRTDLASHTISLENSTPIRQRPYRVSPANKPHISTHIQEMLDHNIIRPSQSPWSSPVIIIPKKDGGTRFVVDYRKLNQVTQKDSYPLPRIDDSLDCLGGASYFSVIDFCSGYFQIPLDEQAKQFTAFITQDGLFEFEVMPFGLCNAPSTFQRLMEQCLRGLQWQICLIYLDDVIIYSKTFEDHLTHLSAVFDRLRDAGLKLKPSKCQFGCKSVPYLGFIATPEGISPDPGKVESVRTYPVPTNLKQVRSFLGLANYYRRFIPKFAHICHPLTQLTRKNQPFTWTSECQDAFDLLKQKLISAPILGYPDFSLEFILHVDASNFALGMVLSQIQNGRKIVIAYASRTLNRSEQNLSATEREALACVDGIKYFQHYLYGRHFTIYTDHAALKWLMDIKDPTGKLARWSLTIQQYDFTIKHRSGTSNGNADALSRRPHFPSISAITKLQSSGFQPDFIRTQQQQDHTLSDLINYLNTSQLPPSDKAARSLLLTVHDYFLEDGILYHIYTRMGRRKRDPFIQLVVPKSLQHQILEAAHNDVLAGHLGITKTYAVVRQRFFWPGMFIDIQHYCKSCVDCAMKKAPKGGYRANLISIPVEGPFDRVGVDCLGPLPVTHSGNRYIVVFTDYFTKWPEAFAVPDIKAPRIAQLLLDHIIARHSAPRHLLSDRGKNFLSKVVQAACDLYQIQKCNTTAFRPSTNGLTERYNQSLMQSLSHYTSSNQKDWDVNLQALLFGFRIAPSPTTGESPFYLLYGRDPILPVEVPLKPPTEISPTILSYRATLVRQMQLTHRVASEQIQLSQQAMKDLYDRKSKPYPYKVGDLVWLFTPKTQKGLSKKLLHNWHGPYRLVEQLSPVNFKLRTRDNRLLPTPVHV